MFNNIILLKDYYMRVKINNETIDLPNEQINIRNLLKKRGINENGTAIAINGRLVERAKWDIIFLVENDDIIIITAAFGG